MMIGRTLFVVVLLSAIQASRQQESLGELRIVEPLPNQVITDKTYLKVEWILDVRLGFNHHVVEGKSLCIQIESVVPSNFAPYKKCYSLCNISSTGSFECFTQRVWKDWEKHFGCTIIS